MDFLRDPIWQVVLALIAVAVSLYIYRKQNKKKSLSYEIVALTPLFNVHKEYEGRLRIFLDGRNFNQLHLLIIRLINTGDIPIVKNDFDEPLAIQFSQDTEPITVEVTKTIPDNLEPEIHIKTEDKISNDTGQPSGIRYIALKKVMLEPLLLNKGDSIEANILISEYKEYKQPVSVTGRIVGVKEIIELENKGHSEFRGTLGIWAGACGIYMIFLFIWLLSETRTLKSLVVSIIFLFLGIACIRIGAYFFKSQKFNEQ